MTTEEKWNRAFELTIPIASIGIGVFSLALTIMSLRRSIALRQRVYYEDGQYLVSVRYLGQWHDLREFVQPDNPDVIAISHQYGPDSWALYDFVCRNIDYRLDIGEFWAYPSEVLAKGKADCEDTSNLLTSLLRSGGINAHTALGNYQGYSHAWTVQNGLIYETTYTQARPVPDPQDYCPYCMFNESEVIELWPGAMEEAFSLQRNEELKCVVMATALEAKCQDW